MHKKIKNADIEILKINWRLKRAEPKVETEGSKENGFELTKKRSRRYPAKTITDADYADDIVILANTPNHAETLLISLEHWPPCQCTQNWIHVL